MWWVLAHIDTWALNHKKKNMGPLWQMPKAIAPYTPSDLGLHIVVHGTGQLKVYITNKEMVIFPWVTWWHP